MKKIFTILTFSLLTCAFAQERIVHQGRMWHPKPMQGDKMEAAMAKKTQKYNVGNENYPMNSFRVITGKDQGAVLRITSRTFADRDKYTLRKSEMDYWQKNVIPHVDMSKDAGTSLWRKMENHSYNGSGNSDRLRYTQVTEYLVGSGNMQEWNQLRSKLVEAHKKTGSKARFNHYYRFSGGETHLIHMSVYFDSWEDYDKLTSVFSTELYDKAHGKGTNKKWLDNQSNIVKRRSTFIREHLPELSSIE
tara:strand:+ start:204 stop:947 length:744 start_codon:yes stop_codon:yes gene_type:complete